MKNLVLILITLISFSTFAQNMDQRDQRMRVAKQEYITEKLELKENQKDSFWALYDEYNGKKRDIRIDITQNRLGLRKTTITDKEARSIIDRELELKQAMVDLEKEYVSKYDNVLSVSQIIKLYKAEDDFNKVVMQRLRQMRGGNDGNRRKPGN